MFNFRLQRVLDLRARRERDAAVRLADAEERADEAKRARASLEATRAASAARLSAAHGGGSTVGQLRSLGLVLESLDARLGHAGTAVEAAEEGVRESADAMREAFRERRVLDRLRERHLDAWRTGEVQADRASMDSIALSRFVQKRARGEG